MIFLDKQKREFMFPNDIKVIKNTKPGCLLLHASINCKMME